MSASSASAIRASPLLGDTPLPMLELAGPEHRVRLVNDSFCALLGEKREALLDRRFVDVVANGEVCAPLLDRAYETGRVQLLPVPAPVGAPGSLWLYALWPTLDPQARPLGVIVQLTRSEDAPFDVATMNGALLIGALHQHELREVAEADKTRLQTEVAERQSAQRSLLEAQNALRREAGRLEATVADRTAELRASVAQLEAFSYSLAHDLRAPVRAIQGFAQLALEPPNPEAGQGAEFFRKIVIAAARMEALIQDVLHLNRVASQPMDIASMPVDSLVRALVAESPELGPEHADVSIDGPLPPMMGHESTFRQCLANLLDNAAKFVPPGERPRVRIWAQRREAAGLSARSAPVLVRLWVEDRGIGIAPEHSALIFGLFQRLHPPSLYEGSGIGLAIVMKAITRMGGGVGVEPGAPCGSRFWLELPIG